MFSKLGLLVLLALGFLPLSWLRALGASLGALLLVVIPSRRRVVQTNLRVCFPHLSDAERDALMRQTFVHFAQAWLDRSWLWHRSAACVQSRGAYGLSDTRVGLPVRLGPGGVAEIVELALAADERAALRVAADSIAARIADLG
jgi:hypothetical protein